MNNVEIQITESARWYALVSVRVAGYLGASEQWVRDGIRQIFPASTTDDWVREILDYLERRNLVIVERRVGRPWWIRLDRYGYDVVDYSVECDPGIARPPRT